MSSGGAVVSFSVSPSLPNGLTLDTTTGEISGTPTTITPSATYTVTGVNSGGQYNVNLIIEVNDAQPIIGYSTTSYTFTKDSTLPTTITPTDTGGTVVTWSIDPSLPNGLNFDTSTGEISGTPTVVSASATYTVTATNSGGDDTVELTIEVIDIPPATVTYNPNAFVETRGTAMISVTPSTTGGTVVSWSIDPALPSGLSLDTSTGEISGTPTVISDLTTYTITATNTGGSLDVTIDITVNDIIPSAITYSSNAYVETKDSSMTTGVPTVGGGPVVTWSISPALPTGLNIDSSTGEISGTPTVLSTVTTYTITATNTGGSATTTIDITINDIPPSLITYSSTSYTFYRISINGVSTGVPTVSGGPVVTWSVSPALPNGLSIDSTTGEITSTPGSPISITPTTTYTITATNSGGSVTTTIDITVNDNPPSTLTYSSSSYVETKDSPVTIDAPIYTGGVVVTWSVSPSLPTGLNIDSSTGEISGTPTVISPQTTYTITGTNTGGSATTTIDITVNDIIPSLVSYSPNSFTETRDSSMTAVTPTYQGGTVTSWSIDPALPTGINSRCDNW